MSMLNKIRVIGDYTSLDKAIITDSKRQEIISFISDLYQIKKYKVETFHLAVNILDRYYSALSFNKRKAPCGVAMATISTLIAAKLEQPVQPSFSKML